MSSSAEEAQHIATKQESVGHGNSNLQSTSSGGLRHASGKIRHSSNFSRYDHSRRLFASLVVYYNRHDAWLTPLPWNSRFQLQCKDMHFELEASVGTKDNRRVVKGQPKRIRDIFQPGPGGKVPPKNVLLIGDPGFGKTSLCRKIAYFWAAHGRTLPGLLENQTVVVYLGLRALDPSSKLEDELVKLALQDESFSRDDPVYRRVRAVIRTFGRNVVVILDGYDELDYRHQKEVKDLLSPGSSSVFRDSSYLVTSKHRVSDDVLDLFQKKFVLRGLSKKSTKNLIGSYFLHTPGVALDLCRTISKDLKLKRPPPFLVLILCYLEDRRGSEYSNHFRSELHELSRLVVKRGNERLKAGLSEAQIEDVLFSFGGYVLRDANRWQTLTQQDLEENLPEDCSFLVASGLLKTADSGLGHLEPLHELLVQSAAAFYLEKHWLACSLNSDFEVFLSSFLELEVLYVSYYALNENQVNFTASFFYKQFHLLYQICDGMESCSVLLHYIPEPNDLGNEQGLTLSISLYLNERSLEDSILDELDKIVPNSSSLLSGFISASKFKNLVLKFSTNSESVAKACFTNLKTSEDTSIWPLKLWTSLMNLYDDVHIVFLKPLCSYAVVSSVLEELLNVRRSELVLKNVHEVFEYLGSSNFPLVNARADWPSSTVHAGMSSSDDRVVCRTPFLFRLFSKPDHSWRNCERIELGFKKWGLSSNFTIPDMT